MRNLIAITGATGFIGRRLVDFLSARPGAVVRVLVRNRDAISRMRFRGEVEQGDMRDPAAFGRLLEEGCTWVNAAHLETPSDLEQSTAVMASLLEVCRKKRVRRLVHCSTAVVVGRSTSKVVTESTECQPGDHYEETKLAIEQCLLREGAEALEVVILRPTAVFGPCGRNLVKLANDLEQRSALVNYLKSCLQGARRMNLVHVDNVVAALVFLLDAIGGVAGETFIISDDEFPINNYRDVECRLMAGLGISSYAIAPISAPRWMLSSALRVAGRTNINPGRIYDCSKIIGRGLKKPVLFEKGLTDFLIWYRGRGAREVVS
jgi:nucleoside-diphosphate-sugar epimerase